ncbi:MAG: hypothetical protein KDB27_30315 [Planctomycetales bacterium]|nr:hypothetical protein [Planctomycetales bacterium]
MAHFERLRIALTVVCAWLVCAFVAKASLAQHTLEWRFEKGQQRESEITRSISQNANGELLTSVATLYVSSTIDDVAADGSAIVTKSVSRATMTVTLPSDVKVEYDSAATEPPKGTTAMFANVLTPLIGQTWQMNVSPQGVVTNVKHLNAPSAASKPGLFSPMFKTKQFEQLVTKSPFEFPQEPVNDGDSWTASGKAVMSGVPVSATTVYTYRGMKEENDKRYDQFDVQTTMSLETPTKDASTENSITPKLTLAEQSSTGELLFDAAGSVVVRSKVEQHLMLTISLGEQTVTQTLTLTTSLKTSIVEPTAPAEEQAAASVSATLPTQ